MPPSLSMYDTTVVLSVATSTILFEQSSWNSFKARKPTLNSRQLCAACFPGGTWFLLQCARLSERPTLLLMRL